MSCAGSSPRVSTLSGLLKGHSILRSETNSALSRLRLPSWERPLALDAGGPTVGIWEAIGMPASGERASFNFDIGRKPDAVVDLDRPWPIASGAFDLIVSSSLLEHLQRPEVFFMESFHALKSGGMLVLTTVLIHQKHGSPRDYFRFTDDGLLALAQRAGFEAETTALLPGPAQCIASLVSSFLLFSWMRLGVLLAARAFDGLLKGVLPFVQENWCAGYVVVARKPLESSRET